MKESSEPSIVGLRLGGGFHWNNPGLGIAILKNVILCG